MAGSFLTAGRRASRPTPSSAGESRQVQDGAAKKKRGPHSDRSRISIEGDRSIDRRSVGAAKLETKKSAVSSSTGPYRPDQDGPPEQDVEASCRLLPPFPFRTGSRPHAHRGKKKVSIHEEEGAHAPDLALLLPSRSPCLGKVGAWGADVGRGVVVVVVNAEPARGSATGPQHSGEPTCVKAWPALLGEGGARGVRYREAWPRAGGCPRPRPGAASVGL